MPEPPERAKILATVKKLVLTRHINVGGVDYNTWMRHLDERTAALLRADVAGFEAGVRDALSELRTSHTAFYQSQPSNLPPQFTLGVTVRRITIDGPERWAFLDVFDEGPAHRAGLRRGDILDAVDGTEIYPPIEPQFAIGRSHTLTIRRGTTTSQVTVDVPMRKPDKRRPPIVEPKSPIFSFQPPDVGLLKIPYFPGAFGMGFARELNQGMRELTKQGCRRLIVDLRGNLGGSLGFAHLASYFCPDRVPIGHSLTPGRLRAGYHADQLPRVPMPRSKMELLATLGRFAFRDKSVMLLTQGLGKQPFHGRIALLVNEWTNSAAEIVASFAQEQGLATIIGCTTRGNVLGAANFKVGSGYWLRLPVFGWFTSKGRNLDGIGVQPDIPADWMAAEDAEIQRGLSMVKLLNPR